MGRTNRREKRKMDTHCIQERKQQAKSAKTLVNLFWLILLIQPFLVVSCRTVKPVFVERVVTDSIYYRDTVVKVILEPFNELNITTDTISRLENKYSKTEAKYINNRLEHNLVSKNIPIDVKVEYKERIITEKVPVPYEVEKIVKVERRLTWLQKVKLRMGEALFFILLTLGGWFLLKIFTKRF